MCSGGNTQQIVERIYRQEARRIFASLVRLLKNFDLAEEALHEAFTLAITAWEKDGVPDHPRAWLVSTGRFKAIDIIRRRDRFSSSQNEIAARVNEISAVNEVRFDSDIEDDRLRLIFTCCHPAIATDVQVPLTLREVCGLTTEEIASAFLISPATLAQRIVRGKAKIRDAGIPFSIPELSELPDRLDSVLSVIYLVFNEGYSASSGATAVRGDLSGEAIRLCRLLLELLPDTETMGLLALMLLQESRRTARTTPDGDIVLLENQDRSLWDRSLIVEGERLVRQAFATGQVGTYSIQAGIAAVHAIAQTPSETDWNEIVSLYDLLLVATPSPVVRLNRAVAVAMKDGPEAGVALIEAILQQGELTGYHLAHAARADLYRRLGQKDAARAAYERALQLASQEPECRFLRARLMEL